MFESIYRRLVIGMMIFIVSIIVTPLSAQDAPLPLPESATQPGIINRAPFEVPADVLPQTRSSFSVTVTMFNDPAVGACNATDGMSLREALVNCSSPTVQPVVYLPSGTYSLTSTITVLDRSFTLIGQNPLTTFIQGSPTDIRYFDLGPVGGDTITFANLTLRNSTSGLSGNALRVQGDGMVRLENIRVIGNQNSGRGTARFDVETGVTLSVTITNCEFSGNTATTGAGVAFTNELGDGIGILNISNTLFSGNIATGNGAGLSVSSLTGASTSITISRTTIANGLSSSGLGGGISMTGNGDPATLTFTTSILDNNTSSGAGGGLLFNNPGGDMFVTDSAVTDNTFVTSGSGAGIFVNTARQAVITGSLIDNNDAKTGTGGGLYFDGAVGQISFFNTTVKK